MAWTWLQSGATEGFSGTSTSCTFTSALSEGSVLLVFVTAYESQVTGVHDANGNSFTQVASGTDAGTGGATYVSLWVLSTPASDVGTKPAITATFNSGAGSPYGAMMIQEVAGISATPDGTAGTIGYFRTSVTVGPPSYASSKAGEYLFYAYGEDGYDVTLTGPGGYMVDPASIMSDAPDANIAIAYKSSTGGTETGQWQVSGSDGLVLVMVAFPLTQPKTGMMLAAFP